MASCSRRTIISVPRPHSRQNAVSGGPLGRACLPPQSCVVKNRKEEKDANRRNKKKRKLEDVGFRIVTLSWWGHNLDEELQIALVLHWSGSSGHLGEHTHTHKHKLTFFWGGGEKSDPKYMTSDDIPLVKADVAVYIFPCKTDIWAFVPFVPSSQLLSC